MHSYDAHIQTTKQSPRRVLSHPPTALTGDFHVDNVYHKSDIVAEMCDKMPDVDKKTVSQSFDAFRDVIAETMVNGDTAKVQGLGTFSVYYRAPRTAIDRETRERYMTEPKFMPRMKFPFGLKQKVVANLSQEAADRAEEEDDE